MPERTSGRTLELTGPGEPETIAARPPRRFPWKSPADQPGYARPTLLLIAAAAATLFAWGIDKTGYHTFYANAARSMSESWRGFIFGSFDPGNSITLDKLPGFLWPQAASAWIFGFHAWSLELPQVIEGVLCVLLLYRVVRLWAGVPAALLAAAAFAVTPVTAGVFRTPAEDAAFTLLLLLAAEAAQRAAHTGRLRTLVMSGVWVGLAVQAKMLEAWVALPALALVYLLAAPGPLRRRLGHLALSGAVMVAVSASWIVLVTLTPAKDRPYIDGTTNNSAFAMVVGYNFLNRFSSVGLSADGTGSIGSGQRGPQPAGISGPGGDQTGGFGAAVGRRGDRGQRAQSGQPTAAMRMPGEGNDGWGKMVGSDISSQTGWLYPFALIALVLGLLWCGRAPRTDRLRAGYVLWGTWLAMFFLVFSAGRIGGHMYYMGVIDLPLAALTGAGLVALWTAFRTGGRRAYALPAALAATVAWAGYIASQTSSFLPWLTPTTLALGVVALVLLVVAWRGQAGRRILLGGLVATVAAVLLAPAAWAGAAIFGSSGAHASSSMGYVGPAQRHGGMAAVYARFLEGRNRSGFGGPGGFGGFGGWGGSEGRRAAGGIGGFGGAPGTKLTAEQQSLVSYLKQHQGGARYLFAVPSWSAASPYILAEGVPVLPMGGFTGQVPFPTLADFQHLVSSGQLHYVLLSDNLSFDRRRGQAQTQITSQVRATCTLVPPTDYNGSSSSQLYRC